MVGREADRARVVGDVVQAEGSRLADEDPEDAAAPRKVADGGARLLVDTRRDEALEPPPGRVDDAERGVPGVGELRGGLDETLQKGVEGQLRAERDPRLDELSQAGAAVRHAASLMR